MKRNKVEKDLIYRVAVAMHSDIRRYQEHRNFEEAKADFDLHCGDKLFCKSFMRRAEYVCWMAGLVAKPEPKPAKKKATKKAKK